MPKSLLDLINEAAHGNSSTPIIFSDADVNALRDGSYALGTPGPPGIPGAGMTWLGAWSGSTMYLAGDGVSYLGSCYIALNTHLNSAPPNSHWDLVASKGDTGAQGLQGIQGTVGAQGNTGADGAAGAQGIAGPNTVTGLTVTTFTGLLKGNGAVVSAASAPGDYVATGDSRLSDARTPTSHATSHKNGGADEVATATAGANLIPKAGAGAKLDIGWIPTGSTSTTVPFGNDARFSDSRTPTAHAASHIAAGSDPLTLSATQITGTAVITTDSRLSLGTAFDPGSISLATERFLALLSRLKLTTTEQLGLAGTARVLIEDRGAVQATVYVGSPKTPPTSFTLLTDYFHDVIQRLNLLNSIRGTLLGTSTLVITDDFATRSRLVLAGKG